MANYLKHKPGSIEEIVAKQTAGYKEDSGYQKMFKKELDKAGKGIGMETMVPNKKDDSKDMKRKQTTMTNQKATKVEMEPKVEYDK